ncbi:MAG: VWA domain-containing protein [Thermoanaerobaculia bacterium]
MSRRLAESLVVGVLAVSATLAAEDPVRWPEAQRAFFQDGPALLLGRPERAAFAALSETERAAFLERFLSDPLPATGANELAEGIRRRLAMARAELLSGLDDRSRVLFLHGAPASRHRVECGQTFVPLEIWRYADRSRSLVLYEPAARQGWRLWLPLDSKQVLYHPDMAYWLEQWERLPGRKPPRFDLRLCPETRAVEAATGVEGLTGRQPGRPENAELTAVLAPPADLGEWSRRAAVTPLPEAPPGLPVGELSVLFPASVRQRLVTRFILELPAGVELGVRPAQATGEDSAAQEVALALEAVIEQEGEPFDGFRVRFRRAPAPAEAPVGLVVERLLRPGRSYLARLRLTDEVTGAETVLTRGFVAPAQPQPVAEPPLPTTAVVALAEELAAAPLAGADALMLVPPQGEFLAGPWRAQAIVTGSRIVEVVFLVDGERQLARTRPPYAAELRLDTVPRTQVVRAEGYDAAGRLVAADQATLNEPRGVFAVRITTLERGSAGVEAAAEVVVPEERRIERVDFLVNDRLAARLSEPPWAAAIEPPAAEGPSFLAVVAELDDGSRAEDVRFLDAPRFGEEVEVRLVELYATVVDRTGAPVADLVAGDFEVLQDGIRQTLAKCEPVDDLPLTVGIIVDTSTSMAAVLPEAQRAATDFLAAVIRPRDRVFVLTFADQPVLALAPTDDVRAAEAALGSLRSLGWTALHDAVGAGLHLLRGTRGRRALILLSDGDDTGSQAPFRDVLELARQSGAAVYTVGLGVSTLDLAVRRKLSLLAEATGGRSFFAAAATDLAGVYQQIERDLRGQYLLAFSPTPPPPPDAVPAIQVRARGGRLKVRTTGSYDP